MFPKMKWHFSIKTMPKQKCEKSRGAAHQPIVPLLIILLLLFSGPCGMSSPRRVPPRLAGPPWQCQAKPRVFRNGRETSIASGDTGGILPL